MGLAISRGDILLCRIPGNSRAAGRLGSRTIRGTIPAVAFDRGSLPNYWVPPNPGGSDPNPASFIEPDPIETLWSWCGFVAQRDWGMSADFRHRTTLEATLVLVPSWFSALVAFCASVACVGFILKRSTFTN